MKRAGIALILALFFFYGDHEIKKCTPEQIEQGECK